MMVLQDPKGLRERKVKGVLLGYLVPLVPEEWMGPRA